MPANISWSIPYQILQDPTYDYINIYRGSDENDISSYKIINIIPRWRCDNKEWEIDSFAIKKVMKDTIILLNIQIIMENCQKCY